MLVPILGSAVLVLAIWRGQISIEEALGFSRLEEEFQAGQWGRDEENEKNWAGKCRDARAAAFFLTCNALK